MAWFILPFDFSTVYPLSPRCVSQGPGRKQKYTQVEFRRELDKGTIYRGKGRLRHPGASRRVVVSATPWGRWELVSWGRGSPAGAEAVEGGNHSRTMCGSQKDGEIYWLHIPLALYLSLVPPIRTSTNPPGTQRAREPKGYGPWQLVPWHTEQAQEEGEGTQGWQKEGSVPIHNIVPEFQVKEKFDAADSLWIGPFRREGEIRNFTVCFSH